MDIEHLRWWHWVLLSLVLGYLLAFVNSAPIEPVGMTEQQIPQFQRDVMHAPIGKDHIPWTKGIRVYPSVEKGALGKPLQIVTYEALAPKKGGGPDEFYYRANWFCAPIPYTVTGQGPVLADPDKQFKDEADKAAEHLPPGIEKAVSAQPGDTLESITASAYGRLSNDGQEAIATANPAFRYSKSVDDLIKRRRMSNGQQILIPWSPEKQKTVRDWLDDAGKNYSWVRYQFAWWKVPRYCTMLWMGSTFAVVGVIWPMTLSVLTGAGLGRRTVDKNEYDLTRIGSEKRKAKAKPKLAETAEEAAAQHQRLVAMNEALTASVSEGIDRASNKPKVGQEADHPATAAGPNRPFVPQAADPNVPVPVGNEEDKEFTGEFYPVAHPLAKPADAKPMDPTPKATAGGAKNNNSPIKP